MKRTTSKFAAMLQTSVYPQPLHQQRPDLKAADPNAILVKGDKVPAKSIDQQDLKTPENARSVSHAR
jgi:hypothetical protein